MSTLLVAAAVGTAAQGARLRVSNPSAGDELFADGAVAHLRIEVSAAEMDVLRSFAFQRDTPQEERPSARCTVREGTNVWNNVAIHLKGSAGSFRAVDDTPSFTLNFSRYEPRQSFHGLEKISLNTSIQDPTRISEKLCREIYRRGQVPVPRAGYATAELNGRRLGLFVLLEGWDRQFIRRYFADSRGPLYEGRFLGDIDQPLILSYGHTNQHDLNIAQLLAAAREPDPSKRSARLEAVLDMDRFARLLALDVLLWNGDGYAFHANNYRIFCDRRQHRFVFLPHGLDQMLGIPDAPLLAGGDGIVAWSVLSLPEGRQRVLERIREFRSSFFQPEAIRRRALEIGSAASSAMARETGSNAGATPAPNRAVVDWLQRLTERVASIDQQLIGMTNLISVRSGQSFVPVNWSSRTVAGTPGFLLLTNPPSLTIRTTKGSGGGWATVLWLEQGRYRLQGKVRQLANSVTHHPTCAFHVRAPRKRSLGLDWGWDGRRRVADDERFDLAYQSMRSTAGTNWAELSCEFDLRQPVADLEILCEASGDGEAWFDLQSLKIARLSDPGRN